MHATVESRVDPLKGPSFFLRRNRRSPIRSTATRTLILAADPLGADHPKLARKATALSPGRSASSSRMISLKGSNLGSRLGLSPNPKASLGGPCGLVSRLLSLSAASAHVHKQTVPVSSEISRRGDGPPWSGQTAAGPARAIVSPSTLG